MNTNRHNSTPECLAVQSQLAAYDEGALAAREAWEVEKHLTACEGCSRALRETRATVTLLHGVERLDVADDFMARLHARLDGVELAEEQPRSPLTSLRYWLADRGTALRQQRVPALGFGLAASTLAVLLVTNRPAGLRPPSAAHPVPVMMADTVLLKANAALAASDPFQDPVAAALEAHADEAHASSVE